jgi:hypothetical protein
MSLPAFFVIHMLTIGRTIMGYETALRYAVPVIVALVPVSVIYGASSSPRQGVPILQHSLRSPRNLLFGSALLVILLSFSGSLVSRVLQVIYFGSELSFQQLAREYWYARYSAFVLAGPARKTLQTVQYLVPAGEPVLASTAVNLHFDFHRNPVLQVHLLGLAAPLQRFPFAGNLDDATAFFADNRIRYVLWQYRGYAVRSRQELEYMEESANAAERTTGHNAIKFFRTLEKLKKDSQILYNDGSFVLFKISRDSA